MDLKEFLSYFDYDIVLPGDRHETRIRQELIEDDDLSPADEDKPLICLVDNQGAYFGDIGKARFPIEQASVEKIIDRMDIYVQDAIDEFVTALENRDIDTSDMLLGEMIFKCKKLDVGEDEVCYTLAEALNHSETIIIQEVAASRHKPLEDQICNAAQHAGQTILFPETPIRETER